MKACVIVTGIPAAGKSTMAARLAQSLNLPLISKDAIKERLFDEIGFQSREQKKQLGVSAMNLMYDMADQLMRCGMPFILENNFENASREGLTALLERHGYWAVTVVMTGDYRVMYDRFAARNQRPERHRGHVVNDCYPEREPGHYVEPPTFEAFVSGIQQRGMDSFAVPGKRIVVDTTDWSKVHFGMLHSWVHEELYG